MTPNKNSGTEQELTYGEKAVGLTFNPSGSEAVLSIKRAYAAIIDHLNDKITGPAMLSGEQARLHKIAITEAQTAQMWAVKAITWQD